MHVLMTGSSGLIGTALREHWSEHSISTIQQGEAEDARHWGKALDLASLPTIDTVVHLAGAGIADKRWSPARKRALIDSRISTTEQLVDELLALEHKPSAVLSASAIGYYGDRGNELLDEQSAPDVSFSSQLCQQWEAACKPLSAAGIRVVNMRFGIVLSPLGGALAKMLPAFKAGGGGRLGDGKQWMSWISLHDLVRAIDHLSRSTEMHGPVNMTAPDAVQNKEFAKLLGQALHRPSLLPMPAMAVKLLFGEMGQELLLGGARVCPNALEESGFSFEHSQLPKALSAILRTDKDPPAE